MNDMIKVSVDPSKIGHMMTELPGGRVTITQPTYQGPAAIGYYVTHYCGHVTVEQFTPADAKAHMQEDGQIKSHGLCGECSEAVKSIGIGSNVVCVDNSRTLGGSRSPQAGATYTVVAKDDGMPCVMVDGRPYNLARFRPVGGFPQAEHLTTAQLREQAHAADAELRWKDAASYWRRAIAAYPAGSGPLRAADLKGMEERAACSERMAARVEADDAECLAHDTVCAEYPPSKWTDAMRQQAAELYAAELRRVGDADFWQDFQAIKARVHAEVERTEEQVASFVGSCRELLAREEIEVERCGTCGYLQSRCICPRA